MTRRILDRKELRADYDAAERDGALVDEPGADAELSSEDDREELDSSDDGDEEKPAAKKKTAPKTPRKPRSRAAKVTRMKVVWAVFNNSNQRVAVFEYPKREEAVALVAKLMTEKRSTHFVQPVKEPITPQPDAP